MPFRSLSLSAARLRSGGRSLSPCQRPSLHTPARPDPAQPSPAPSRAVRRRPIVSPALPRAAVFFHVVCLSRSSRKYLAGITSDCMAGQRHPCISPGGDGYLGLILWRLYLAGMHSRCQSQFNWTFNVGILCSGTHSSLPIIPCFA